MQPEVVAEIAARWRQLGGRVLLETNGTLVDAFEKVADNIDIVSMDIKLQPAVEKTPWQQQQRFLEHAVKRCDSVYVKVVVGKEVSISQLEEAAQLVAAAGKHIPFILQAEAECSQSKDLQGQLEQFQWRLSRWLPDVRIIPQLHKLLGVR